MRRLLDHLPCFVDLLHLTLRVTCESRFFDCLGVQKRWSIMKQINWPKFWWVVTIFRNTFLFLLLFLNKMFTDFYSNSCLFVLLHNQVFRKWSCFICFFLTKYWSWIPRIMLISVVVSFWSSFFSSSTKCGHFRKEELYPAEDKSLCWSKEAINLILTKSNDKIIMLITNHVSPTTCKI